RAVMSRLSEQQARATAMLVLDYLRARPANRQDQALADLNQHFGYPLTLLPRTELDLDVEQQRRLERDEVVFTLTDSTRRDAGVRVLVPVPGGERILVMGPLHLFDQFPWELLVIAGVVALLLVALSTYLQVRPLQTRLRRLDRAVKRLGSGDLGAYADIPGNDPIGQVAAT
ncbi:MAG TPA: two-component sensor histidine kinase, partial [Alcanivorax sp.]|nr:two-component sensor histidine kinase [Alcanivorax sp.]